MLTKKKITFAEMRDTVKWHIRDMLQRQTMREFMYIDLPMQKLINFQTEQELAELTLTGNLTNYYNRVIRGAI